MDTMRRVSALLTIVCAAMFISYASAASAQQPKFATQALVAPKMGVLFGVVTAVDDQAQFLTLTAVKKNSAGKPISQVFKVKWSSQTGLAARGGPMTISDLKVGMDVFVVLAGGQIRNIHFPSSGPVMDLRASECRALGCSVRFNANCPRTGDKNPTDRYECVCTTGAQCIDESD